MFGLVSCLSERIKREEPTAVRAELAPKLVLHGVAEDKQQLKQRGIYLAALAPKPSLSELFKREKPAEFEPKPAVHVITEDKQQLKRREIQPETTVDKEALREQRRALTAHNTVMALQKRSLVKSEDIAATEKLLKQKLRKRFLNNAAARKLRLTQLPTGTDRRARSLGLQKPNMDIMMKRGARFAHNTAMALQKKSLVAAEHLEGAETVLKQRFSGLKKVWKRKEEKK